MRVLIPISAETKGGIRAVIESDIAQLEGQCDFIFLGLGQNSPFFESLKERGFKVFCTGSVPENLATILDNPFYCFRKKRVIIKSGVQKYFCRLLEREKVDLIHSHKIGFLALFGPAAKKKNIPIIQAIHTLMNYPYPFHIGERFAAHYMNRYAALSYGVARVALIQFSPYLKGPLKIVYNSIKPFSIREKTLENRLTIGVLTRIKPAKGLEVFLEAARKITKDYGDVEFIVAGSASSENEAYLSKLKLSVQGCRAISFIGFVAKEDFFSKVDILCVPSFSEVCSMVILEAFFAGCCVVATRVGGNHELIEDRRNGLLVEAGSSEEIESAIRELLFDTDLRLSLQQEAAKSFNDTFSSERHKKELLIAYESVLSVNKQSQF